MKTQQVRNTFFHVADIFLLEILCGCPPHWLGGYSKATASRSRCCSCVLPCEQSWNQWLLTSTQLAAGAAYPWPLGNELGPVTGFQESPCGTAVLDQRCRIKYIKWTFVSGVPARDVLFYITVGTYQIMVGCWWYMNWCYSALHLLKALIHCSGFDVCLVIEKRLKFQIRQLEKMGSHIDWGDQTNGVIAVGESQEQASQLAEQPDLEWTEVPAFGMAVRVSQAVSKKFHSLPVLWRQFEQSLFFSLAAQQCGKWPEGLIASSWQIT